MEIVLMVYLVALSIETIRSVGASIDLICLSNTVKATSNLVTVYKVGLGTGACALPHKKVVH